MTTINEELQYLSIQQNTLSIISTALSRLSANELYLTFGSPDTYDEVRINAIRDYLIVEKTIVEGLIDDVLNHSCVSGC